MSKKETSLAYRNYLRTEIIKTSYVMFRTLGFKAVKMDDISHQLGISKRTLYEIYPNKEDLIFESFKYGIEKKHAAFAASIPEDADVMDILTKFLRMRISETDKVNPVILDEIPNYPRLSAYIEENRKKHNEEFVRFFLRGQEEGYFLKDINLDLLREINHGMSEHFMECGIHRMFSQDDILRTMMHLFIRGLCTVNGIRRIDEVLQHYK